MVPYRGSPLPDLQIDPRYCTSAGASREHKGLRDGKRYALVADARYSHSQVALVPREDALRKAIIDYDALNGDIELA
jgi:hypothetical protein